ncbi:MAG: tRNA threonylcarbamoyladenosine dehydratase [Lachnospiraceae bacterium]|nr:tRNA threonylcarbamoyladenosine dehydratase [Lachnospiraceae bacterium]
MQNKESWCSRTEILLGAESIKKLEKATVAVFGIGGVGGFAAEALARSGVGNLELIDHDTVSVSNINRQIVALHSTVGKYKVDVMKDRILDINPEINVVAHKCFYLPETAAQFDFSKYDYVVDCIDTVTGKLQLVEAAKAAGIPIICSMGAGNKLDPAAFEVADISKTSVCPLAKVMRRELKKRNIKGVKVVYSKEEPVEAKVKVQADTRKSVPGSCAFVPSVAGLILAGEVIKDLAAGCSEQQQKG